ncbi:Vigilin [Thelohanellus kitauei]|uniref:Vigilin n=1 Tax=Thelohanellus kitauei TaxID=669202 RepID=A0A0C2IXH9_THEKT|nr:Vigilin [Thelohanellus kitauei]
MARKKSKNSGENQQTGPPIEQEAPVKQSAIAIVMAQANNPRIVTVSFPDRRFKQDDVGFQKAFRDISSKYNLELKHVVNSLKNLVIEFNNKGPLPENQVRLILRDVFSVQQRTSIHMSEKILKQLSSDKAFLDSLSKNRYVLMRTDHASRSLVMEGGRESVALVSADIQDYIAWNTDSVSLPVDIPVVFHEFIRGPASSTINSIIESSGNFVDVAFEKPSRNQVLLTGNSKCVEKARDLIISQYNRLNSTMTKKSLVLPKTQYFAFKQQMPQDVIDITQVSVVAVEGKDNRYLVEIAGESFKVDEVCRYVQLALRENQATSIDCPYWICMYMSIFDDFKKSFALLFENFSYEINPHDETITVFCHESRTNEVVPKIRNIIADLKSDGYYDSLIISDSFARILESKDRKEWKRIEAETATSIFIDSQIDRISIDKLVNCSNHAVPPSSTSSGPKTLETGQSTSMGFSYDLNQTANSNSSASTEALCLIVGVKSQVDAAKDMILDLITFYDSFITLNMKVPNHFHRFLIGVKGKALNEMILSNGPNCTISFGKESPNLDSCIIRGPEAEVAVLAEAMNKKVEEFDEIHHLEEIEIPAQAKELVLNGKDLLLNTLRKFGIVDNLVFPSTVNSSRDIITIIGKREIVLQYSACLSDYIQQMVHSVTKNVPIPEPIVAILKEFGDFVVRAVTVDAGSFLTIRLPKNISKKEKMIIFGPQKYVDRASTMIQKLASCNGDYSFEFISVPSQYVPKLRDQTYNVIKREGIHVLYPSSKRDEEAAIFLIGNSSGVLNTRNVINEAIKAIQNTVEKKMLIKAEFKKDFLKKSSDNDTLVNRLTRQHNVSISISDRVKEVDTLNLQVSGNKKDVDEAVNTINNLIAIFNQRTEAKVLFQQDEFNHIHRRHRDILKETQAKMNVILSVSQNFYDSLKAGKFDGDCEVTIKGLPSDVSATQEMLKNWKIVTISHPIAYYVQRNIIRPKTQEFNHLVHALRVDIDLGWMHNPPLDFINLSGLKPSVECAVEYINELADKEFEVRIKVDPKYYTRLIGKKGSFIQNFKLDNNVSVSIPEPSDGGDIVSIFGRKSDCYSAMKNLEALLAVWDSSVDQEFQIDSRVKPQVCGPKNETLRQIAKRHDVYVSVPPFEDIHAPMRTIRVSGPRDKVNKFIDIIKAESQTILDELDEAYDYNSLPNYNYELDINAITVIDGTSQKKANKKKAKKNQLDSGTAGVIRLLPGSTKNNCR